MAMSDMSLRIKSKGRFFHQAYGYVRNDLAYSLYERNFTARETHGKMGINLASVM